MPIQDPSNLRGLSAQELEDLAGEIRQEIISACLTNGGHLGASLGTVELAIALHSVFRSPVEPIIWDVGHQAYAHKLLTGRWERFKTLRTEGGISGFLSREESEHDIFGAGHSSTSLSAALAISRTKKTDWTVAVIGDGGLSAGLAFEALNNFRSVRGGPLLVVLNDNQMSISKNVGSLAAVLAEGRAQNYFELFGLSYEGPVNGHDLQAMILALQHIRELGEDARVVLHVHTHKGRGYAPAEENPANFHGVSPISKSTTKQTTYSDVFGETLCELAERDSRIVAITAAMPEGTGLVSFATRFPDRFFDVGIAEAHAVTFAAGLASQGLRPYVALYSTFMQRAYDSIIHDVALQGLPIVLAVDRAGPVGADGPTHHGMFDLVYLATIPGVVIKAPSCLEDLRYELVHALSAAGPVAIRYPRGGGPEELAVQSKEGYRVHQRASDPRVQLVAVGTSAVAAVEAAKRVDPQAQTVSVYSLIDVQPIPQSFLTELSQSAKAALLTVEAGSIEGGVGQRLSARLKRNMADIVGYGPRFYPHGSVGAIEKMAQTDVAGIESRLRRLVEQVAK
jgi:1-deoxy-D-xylulose-5-phosphate synthase